MKRIRIRIPANMRPLTGQQPMIEVSAATVGEALDDLLLQYPDLRPRLLDESGELHGFVNLFAHDRSVRDLQGLSTPFNSDTELLIISALAGG